MARKNRRDHHPPSGSNPNTESDTFTDTGTDTGTDTDTDTGSDNVTDADTDAYRYTSMSRGGRRRHPSSVASSATGRKDRTKGSQKPGIAGALLIICGIIGILFGTVLLATAPFVDELIDNNWSAATRVIRGRVTTVNGTPIANATITVHDDNLTVTTNASGAYVIHGVPVGYCEITVEKTGYRTVRYKTFIVEKGTGGSQPGSKVETGDDVELDFTLRKGAGTRTYGVPVATFARMGMTIFGAISLFFALVALVGGLYALKRRKLWLVVLGSILGFLSVGFAIGSILALVALFIAILARKEFARSKRSQKGDGDDSHRDTSTADGYPPGPDTY